MGCVCVCGGGGWSVVEQDEGGVGECVGG